jgi:hypothetical protein
MTCTGELRVRYRKGSLKTWTRSREPQSIYDESIAMKAREPKIDYFATSLPAMLLFDEDLTYRNRVSAYFLRAQALYGLSRTSEAMQSLSEVLAMDVNHAAAVDLNQNLPLLETLKGSATFATELTPVSR